MPRRRSERRVAFLRRRARQLLEPLAGWRLPVSLQRHRLDKTAEPVPPAAPLAISVAVAVALAVQTGWVAMAARPREARPMVVRLLVELRAILALAIQEPNLIRRMDAAPVAEEGMRCLRLARTAGCMAELAAVVGARPGLAAMERRGLSC